MADFQNHISSFFVELLESHVLPAKNYDGWVTVGDNFPAFRAFYDQPEQGNASGVLSIQVMLDETSLIEECFAAFGDSDIEAINGALGQFAMSMFHPIICACCDYVVDEHVTKETWKLKMFSKADIWSGNIALRLSTDVDVKTPIDWLTNISTGIKETKIRKGFNWITLYCSRLNDDPLIASATLNNENWPKGLQVTTELDWPQIGGFYGARLFILLKN